VKVFVPIVSSGGFVVIGGVTSVVVTPFTTKKEAPGAREIIVFATVITPPGVSSEPPIR